jgi:bifunctional DNA-binding transcriptional regulator/antitoxin component of YhaV-PrlF toxin-antitoxin module
MAGEKVRVVTATLGEGGTLKIPVELRRFWDVEGKTAVLVFFVRNDHVVILTQKQAAELLDEGLRET